jgi:hypothetical protein
LEDDQLDAFPYSHRRHGVEVAVQEVIEVRMPMLTGNGFAVTRAVETDLEYFGLPVKSAKLVSLVSSAR